MSLDLELAKILDEFAVPEAFKTKLLDSACLKVWPRNWTSILSSLEPPIRAEINSNDFGGFWN